MICLIFKNIEKKILIKVLQKNYLKMFNKFGLFLIIKVLFLNSTNLFNFLYQGVKEIGGWCPILLI